MVGSDPKFLIQNCCSDLLLNLDHKNQQLYPVLGGLKSTVDSDQENEEAKVTFTPPRIRMLSECSLTHISSFP